MDFDKFDEELKLAGFYDFFQDEELRDLAKYSLSLIYDENMVIERRESIIGIKRNNEKLRLYITLEGIIYFPLIKEKIDFHNVLKEQINENVDKTKDFCIKNPDSLILQTKIKEQKKKKEKKEKKPLATESKKKEEKKISKRVLKFYQQLENKIIFYIQSKEYNVSREEVYEHFFSIKKRYLFTAMMFSHKILLFSKYIELIDRLDIYNEDLIELKNEIELSFDYEDTIRFRSLFNKMKNSGLFTRNGIDDVSKAFEFVSKLLNEEYYFDRKTFAISKEPFLSASKKNDIEFTIDSELMKYLDIGDIE